MELFMASNLWSSAPAPNRFWDVEDGLAAAFAIESNTVQVERDLARLRVEPEGANLYLGASGRTPARLTNNSFRQLVGFVTPSVEEEGEDGVERKRKVSSPAEYLQSLPPTLAAQNLNYGLARLTEKPSKFNLLREPNSDTTGERYTALSVNSQIYDYVANSVVLRSAKALTDRGWRTPRAATPPNITGLESRLATEDDVMPGSMIRAGMRISPAGVYVYETRMFVLVIDPNVSIDDGAGNHLFRFMIFYNSTDGSRVLGGVAGWLATVCMNHILWGVQQLNSWSVRHAHGKASEVAGNLTRDVLAFASDFNVSRDYAVIKASRLLSLGKDKDEVIEKLLGKRIPVAAKLASQAYDLAEVKGIYGDPRTVWGMANGLTELSQQSASFERRHAIDLAAGKVLDLAADTLTF